MVNAVLRFPTKNKKKFKFKRYYKSITKGRTPEQAFRFLRVPDKNDCDMFCIEALKVVGKTNIVDN